MRLNIDKLDLKIENNDILGLVIDAVVQIVLLFFFFCISALFIKGEKDVR